MRFAGRSIGKRKEWSRVRRLALLVLLVAGIVLAVVLWPWSLAQVRTVVVISSLLDTLVVAPVVERVTGEPRFEHEPIAGNPSLVVRPAGKGPWPVFVFVNGVVPEGRKLPEVRRLAEGLARADYLVIVPDLPGLRNDEVRPEAVSETVEVVRAVSGWPQTRGERVGMIGVSTGASLAVLAAEDPGLEGRLSVVAGLSPYADIRTVLNIATTGYYRQGGEFVPYQADPFLSYVAARSLVAAMSPGEDRTTLNSELQLVDRFDPDPLAGFRARPVEDLGPEARSVVRLLANRDPERFSGLYSRLPSEVRGDLKQLSPIAGSGEVEAAVELASGPEDRFFPVRESYRLARISLEHRVTVSGALDHWQLEPSLQELPEFIRFNGFVVRSLRETQHSDG